MQMNVMLILLVTSISLTGCSSMTGNVVPQKGPTMEQVYDSMEVEDHDKGIINPTVSNAPSIHVTENTFHKLPNPELKMYVFPHLAGQDEIPIPGYYTQFNAYTRDYYALPSETF